MDALRFEGVSHAYDTGPSLLGIDLAVRDGEILCLLGPSGSGKSTLLRVAAGLEVPSEGRVLIDGRTVAEDGRSLPPEERNVGLVFQDYALFPHLTVLDNIAFGLKDMGRQERRARARDILGRVGLADYADRYPHALSGGEQQRVALARALAPKPHLMLMDEPFSGLDAGLRDTVRDATLELLRAEHATTLIVTHDPEEAMLTADRIALMRAGRVVQVGTPDELYRHPNSDFVARFFSQVNEIRGAVVAGHVETRIGRFCVSDDSLADGEQAQILLRPEAIGWQPPDGGVEATVLSSRSMGAETVTRLSLADGTVLTARMRERPLARGSRVQLTVASDEAFVFPAP
ncbi:ABC transporter ATP-binding protein [Oceanibacterium hippocampi]|uniref:Fe(3+) ions import ATP-binding protein FbpC n=1 Tax=Oceanibacterium hippocampi TaxID=745714 RepID=A0A1Y5TZI4_9PROT|nr:ABC transporter ATP-binding protein [Oceanibacterium hippocampi]SLN77228.1 Fe(3+) ions import ATP-binding protein FbpC [Oceanibacterium hippocampi]